MSFTSIVKNEVSKLENDKVENISELAAILKNSATIDNKIRITTENASVARHIFSLLKELYGIISKITVRQGYNYSKNYIYMLEFSSKVNDIIEEFNLSKNIPNEYLVSDEKTLRAYLKGLFLACGSINDPKKSRYHLEFIVDSEEYAIFINDLLNKYFLNSKYLKRENKYMIYIKESEKISDFLRLINAINALFYYEDIRIYRDHKNMTNRLNNCEQANIDKAINTAMDQLNDIKLIEQFGGLELLPEKEQIVAIYRKKYRDSTLLELSKIISMETGIEITKSGIYHRFKKIKDLANKIRKNNDDFTK